MKCANLVKLSVFVHERENLLEIEKSFLSFLPFDFEKEKIKISKINAKGFEEKKIIILETTLIKESHINKFLKNLNEKLSNETRQLILRQALTRLNPEYSFYLRFDKDKLMENNLELVDHGNCFHIKISLALFNKTNQAALELLKKIFA